MKKLLLISTQYPIPGTGIRTAGLVRYLPDFGWEVVMITPTMPGRLKAGANVIEVPSADFIGAAKASLGIRPGDSVSQRIGFMGGPGTPNVREAALSSALGAMKGLLAYPDARRGWIRPAIRAANKTFSTPASRPPAVLSSSPMVSGHIVAYRLARQWGTSWVADLRDLWSDNPYDRHVGPRRQLDARLEHRILGTAHSISTVSDELAAALMERHGRDVVVITNGFDPEALRPGDIGTNSRFTISHTGGMYGGKRDPRALLLAVRQMVDAGEVAPDRIHVDFFGPREVWLDQMIRDMRLEHIVSQSDYVASREAVAAQRASHLLLLLTWDDPADRGTCPVKLFEYMAARRPVLALGYRQSAGSRIVEECRLGRAFASDDVSGVKTFLREAIQRASHADPQVDLDPDSARRYSQVEMARKFAHLLDEAAAPP